MELVTLLNLPDTSTLIANFKLILYLQGSGRALLTKRRSGESFMLIDDSALESSTQSDSGEDAQKAASDGLPAPARLPAAAGRQMRNGNASSPGEGYLSGSWGFSWC